MRHFWLLIVALVTATGTEARCQTRTEGVRGDAAGGGKRDTARGDRMIAEYFRLETQRLSERSLTDIESLEAWTQKRSEYRRQLLEMLGLDPLPEKTDLQATVTGQVEHEDFVVEKVHFQSRPRLYVTGNLYLPKQRSEPLPAILYVCGHAAVKKDGISYGGKTHYQHHAAWFARHGYVCLIIDTLQLGEIEGIHHGTYREKMWWWLNRGYTPAGVEAWNCVRALDYLQSREEVDGERIGVTGRSGGGGYSWWIAAIDDRIKCAVPVAGITDLRNHVVEGMPGRFADGSVEGHCDCMFIFNSYRWDYPRVAALVAPRPLLISNTDSDNIFPLDGVYRLFEQVRSVYRLYGAEENVALNICPGGHADTQELRVNAFHWFNRHLKGDDTLIDQPAVKFFEPEQLRVFDKLPEDRLNSEIHESFVAKAKAILPNSQDEWDKTRAAWKTLLREKCFAGWPEDPPPLEIELIAEAEADGIEMRLLDFTSQRAVQLSLFTAKRADLEKPDLMVLNVLDEEEWQAFAAGMRPGFESLLETVTKNLPAGDEDVYTLTKSMFQSFDWQMAWVAPRGIGPTTWNQDEFKQTQHRRRFYLLGQTLDGMRVWDVRRAMQALRQDQQSQETQFWLQSSGAMGGVALYASLFEPPVARLDLHNLPRSHRQGPFFLNVRRYLDMPQALAMAAERSRVILYQPAETPWPYPAAVMKMLGKPENLQIRQMNQE